MPNKKKRRKQKKTSSSTSSPAPSKDEQKSNVSTSSMKLESVPQRRKPKRSRDNDYVEPMLRSPNEPKRVMREEETAENLYFESDEVIPESEEPQEDVQKEETAEYDSFAYEALHRLSTDWPCMTLDFVPDPMGSQRKSYPLSCYCVGGTCAPSRGTSSNARRDPNKLYVWHLSNMHETKFDGQEDGEEVDDKDDPVLNYRAIPHLGSVNRVRVMPQAEVGFGKDNIVASASSNGKVYLYNISRELCSLANIDTGLPKKKGINKPIYTYSGHRDECYALDWSRVADTPTLATGDESRFIHVWKLAESRWVVNRYDEKKYKGHKAGVECVVWSPAEDTVFASGSCDRTIKLWDIRVSEVEAQMTIQASLKYDINSLAWHSTQQNLLLSGDDNGHLKVWDLRECLQMGKSYIEWEAPREEGGENEHCLAHFSYLGGMPVTSVAWNPVDESTFAVTCDDPLDSGIPEKSGVESKQQNAGKRSCLTVWDTSLEDDEDEDVLQQGHIKRSDVPPQLLFVHEGLSHIKEMSFHPQVPGFMGCTGAEGLNFFKPDNIHAMNDEQMADLVEQLKESQITEDGDEADDQKTMEDV